MSSRIAIPLHGGPTACQAEGGTIYETVRFNFFCFFKVEILEAFTGFETANKYKVSENLFMFQVFCHKISSGHFSRF